MKLNTLKTVATLIAAMGTLAAAPAFAGKTVDAIKARGQVVCGVNTGLAGFGAADSAGKWNGLDVDVCRAVAAAVLSDPEKVKYVPLNAQARFTALQSGEIDVLSRNTTFTLTRDASLGLSATAVTYYDGQGFMVPVKSKIKSAKQLKGQTVCVQSGTTTEKNLTDFSKASGLGIKPVVFEKLEAAEGAYFSGRCVAYTTDASGLGIKPVVFEKLEAAEGAYFSGRCVAYTTDASGLASTRNKVAKNPADHLILPDLISKEPLGPMVRRGDDEWTAIVKWTIYGLLEAEEYGVTAANVDDMKANSKDPVVGRLLGSTEDTGKLLGLDKEWLARAIKATGNYGEIFERNVGPKSALQLPRGLNNQWNKGGLQYAIPVR